jgi:hypothetical protein
VQSLGGEVGPIPKDPKGRAFLQKEVQKNAFTIKLPDRALLFEVERLEEDGSRSLTSTLNPKLWTPNHKP